MKGLLKSRLFFFILGAIVFSSITTVALTIASKDVSYDNTSSGAQNANVQGAIDELYERVLGTEQYFTLLYNKDANALTYNIKVVDINSETIFEANPSCELYGQFEYEDSFTYKDRTFNIEAIGYNATSPQAIIKIKYNNNVIVVLNAGASEWNNYYPSNGSFPASGQASVRFRIDNEGNVSIKP